MAFATKNNQNTTSKQNLPTLDLRALHAAVVGARRISDNVVVFTLRLDGLSLYNMRCVYKKKDDSLFITPPQTKYNDKYYDTMGLFLSAEDMKKLCTVICANYAEKGEDVDYKKAVPVYSN